MMMLSYCLKCRQNTESKIADISKTKNRKVMLLPRRAVCGNKKSKLFTEQEASGLLS